LINKSDDIASHFLLDSTVLFQAVLPLKLDGVILR